MKVAAFAITTTMFETFQRLDSFDCCSLTHLKSNAPFLYPLKFSENLRISDVFKGIRHWT